jgi:hypothetical protein
MLAGRHGTDLADLDLGRDHLVPEAGDDRRDVGEPILTLVCDEHPEPFHVQVRALDTVEII